MEDKPRVRCPHRRQDEPPRPPRRFGCPRRQHLERADLRLHPGRRVVREEDIEGRVTKPFNVVFPELGAEVRRPQTLRRWLQAYAAATATTASYEKIRDAATAGETTKPTKTTTIPYRDALERLWILDPLPAWAPTTDHLARLTFAPEHHLADPALAVRLTGVDAGALLRGEGPTTIPRDGTFLGALFESLVTLSVRVFAQAAEARVSHFRTKGADQGRRARSRPDHRAWRSANCRRGGEARRRRRRWRRPPPGMAGRQDRRRPAGRDGRHDRPLRLPATGRHRGRTARPARRPTEAALEAAPSAGRSCEDHARVPGRRRRPQGSCEVREKFTV